MHTNTHSSPTLAVTEKHTLDAQRKDHLQLNYVQIEPWERRSSKAELELNAEAVCLYRTNTRTYAFLTEQRLLLKYLPLVHTGYASQTKFSIS